MKLLLSLVLFLAVLGTGCEGDTKIYNELPSPTAPTPVRNDVIEFRVSGTYPSVIVRTSNSMDGLSQLTTGLPFTSRIESKLETIFLSLEVIVPSTSLLPNTPYLQVQILVNGILFREANSTQYYPTLNVSGTFRRPTTLGTN